MPRLVSMCVGIAVCVLSACWSEADAAPQSVDTRLTAARKHVEASKRYLHHSALKRGMKGYGLTVFAGFKPVRFDAEIVSVVAKFGPHRDVILATLAGHKLEKTMIISGMSGSPVYMKDPKDGKFKMIGAVAYGWNGQNEPLCGIQPITQMLAAGGFLSVAGSDKAPGGKLAPAGRSSVPKGFLRTALGVKKIDFAFSELASFDRGYDSEESTRMVELSTPVMVSGMSSRALSRSRRMLKSVGMIPLQGGGVGAAQAAAWKNAKLVPGGGIAVPLAAGDADMTAVGTVTDVVKNNVMAFGHSFFSYGPAKLPMGPAYIHTVVSGRNNSFKLGSLMRVTGTMTRDEETAIAGTIGPKPQMIPMKVLVDWVADKRKQTFNFAIAQHPRMTPIMVSSMLSDAAWGWRSLPERHHVSYSMTVDFGKLGKYKASNMSSGSDVYWAGSDLDRALFSMMRNPYGPRPEIRSIDVSIKIMPGEIDASIVDFRLDTDTFEPGDTLTGTLTLARPRQKRTTMPVKFKLPDDLPEGIGTLQVCDWSSAASADMRAQPHKYRPKTTREFLASLQRSVLNQGDVLYMRMGLPNGGGIALDKKELPDLPASKSVLITQANLLDTRKFSNSLQRTQKVKYVLSGSAAVRFRVVKHRRQKPVVTDAE